jgi:hypothetical protein
MDRTTIIEKAVAAYSFEGFAANLIPAAFFRHAAERAVQALDQAEAEEVRDWLAANGL